MCVCVCVCACRQSAYPLGPSYLTLRALAFPPAAAPVPAVAGETLKALVVQAQAFADLGSELGEEKAKERSAYVWTRACAAWCCVFWLLFLLCRACVRMQSL